MLTPWSQFLNGVRRRFCIRGTVGEAILSDVGFPEGDPLSTVGMVVADVIFHTYLRVFEPRVRSHSFVDNLAITSADSGALVKSYHLVECFSEMLDLRTDPEKTYAWALTPDMRKCLKSLQIPILRHARDLGGLMSYAEVTRTSWTDAANWGLLGKHWRALLREPEDPDSSA